MQSGKFAGQTFDQAFGNKSRSSGETESKPQESPSEPPQEIPPKPPEAPQAESKPVEPTPAPAQPPAPETKPPEPPQATSTPEEGIELPSGPDATPRDRASAADQANQQQYAGARASAVSNIGEDIMGSARHRALLWRGLEAAEQDGSAAEAITRDQLLKHEPHSLMTSVDTNPLASLAMYYALRKFLPNQVREVQPVRNPWPKIASSSIKLMSTSRISPSKSLAKLQIMTRCVRFRNSISLSSPESSNSVAKIAITKRPMT
jgi:pyruvate/2-oxoglutarate dehydrogenase complex dihydrolipoamide acyltransferase (E2) component